MTSTVAEINLSNLSHNLSQVRNAVGQNVKICLAVKADSYGHGAVPCAKKALECGVDFLSVARVFEGVELRKNGIKCPVLILSLADFSEIEEMVENDITPLVFDEEYIEEIAKVCEKLNKKNYSVHLAIDSGMGRVGCYPEEAGIVAKKIADSGLSFGGICTHLCVSDVDSEDAKKFTDLQFKRFMDAVSNVEKMGINPGIRHCEASAALFDSEKYNLDMVRPGIVAYGYWPGDMNEKYFAGKGKSWNLKPVMTFKTQLCAVKKFTKGQSVSYGRTYICEKDTTIGILPAGYADGLNRLLSNKFTVSINGKSYPQVGRICMDQCMVDLGEDFDKGFVKRHDEVVIFGEKVTGSELDADDIAEICNTISYEVTCNVSKRVPRISVL